MRYQWCVTKFSRAKRFFIIIKGDCIGIACTTMTLCDLIYAVPSASFSTPFMKIALCAEGCSSYSFPRYDIYC